MVGVQVHLDGATNSIRHHRSFAKYSGHEHPPALGIPLEAVADRLSQTRPAGRLLPVPAPALTVLGVAVQGRQHLNLSVFEPYPRDDQVLALFVGPAVRQPGAQGKKPVISQRGHAQLAATRLISTAQHEEVVAAGPAPIPDPVLVTGIPVGLQVVLLSPQLPGAKAETHPPGLYVRLQFLKFPLQVTRPAPLLVQPVPPGSFPCLGNLPLGPGYTPLQRNPRQPLLLLDRSHLPFQSHPHCVEDPNR